MRWIRGGCGWRRWRALALVLPIGLVGCATVPNTSPRIALRPLRPASLDEVRAAYDAYCDGVQTLSASGDLDVADLRTGKRQRVSVRLVATRTGKLYLKGTVAFVTGLEIVSDGERFSFALPRKKTAWVGPARATRERTPEDSAPYYALRPRDLIDALFPEQLKDGSVLLYLGDGASLTLVEGASSKGPASRRVSLARDTLELSGLRTYDSRGDIVVEVEFGEWKDGMPRKVEIERPQDGYEASFRFSKIERNAKVPEGAFVQRIPKGYTVKEIPN
jgi:hypothetical protein